MSRNTRRQKKKEEKKWRQTWVKASVDRIRGGGVVGIGDERLSLQVQMTQTEPKRPVLHFHLIYPPNMQPLQPGQPLGVDFPLNPEMMSMLGELLQALAPLAEDNPSSAENKNGSPKESRIILP